MQFVLYGVLLSPAILIASYKVLSRKTVKHPSMLPPRSVLTTVNFLYRAIMDLERLFVPPPLQLMRLSLASLQSQALYAVTELKIPDLLHQHPKGLSPQRLAELTKVKSADELRRVLRCLVQIGVFYEKTDGTFVNTRVSELARTDHQMSVAPAIGTFGDESYKAYGNLLPSLLDGENAFKKSFGESIWDYYRHNGYQRERFDKFMTSSDMLLLGTVMEGYAADWNKYSTIADIGGGYGSMLEFILDENQHASAILFDLPEMIEKARKLPRWSKDSSAGKRTKLVEGSFFDSVPAGADLYILRNILHDWSDADSLKILKNIRKAIPSHGKLLIMEHIIPEAGYVKDDLLHSMSFDVLLMTGCDHGKERMVSEWHKLLAGADFKINRLIQTKDELLPLIECIPV
eukprot:TRINITY_DN412_c0_g1_i1.p1 TRINITY_DN412_c0_g1~~TRINITY_DN412_c0_g1_i1.p1  ORF type:complete len:403 (+),score=51.50 TRINITY_DN412_c0_g1_i1:234-1442(+)